MLVAKASSRMELKNLDSLWWKGPLLNFAVAIVSGNTLASTSIDTDQWQLVSRNGKLGNRK